MVITCITVYEKLRKCVSNKFIFVSIDDVPTYPDDKKENVSQISAKRLCAKLYKYELRFKQSGT